MPVVRPRHYRRTAEHHFGLKLDEKFAPLQQRCSILAAAGENTKERVMAILDEVGVFCVCVLVCACDGYP